MGSPLTVEDVWQLRIDSARLADAAEALRRLATEFDAAAGLLQHGQAALGRLLDRLDVPSLCGVDTITFFPHDDADVSAIQTAIRAAREVRAAVAGELHRCQGRVPSTADAAQDAASDAVRDWLRLLPKLA